MIVSASRRTDIPALHFPWFLDRMRLGFVDVKNPFNAQMTRRVSLNNEDADLVVFWTKDSRPMIPLLPEFESYRLPYIVLFTITPYDETIEPGIRDKDGVVEAFRSLADRIGAERLAWRYDPIILSPSLTPAWHLERFENIARRLEGKTRRCITSFAVPYRRVRSRLEALGWTAPPPETRRGLLAGLAAAAAARGIRLQTCADETPPAGEAAPPAAHPAEPAPAAGACIDERLVSRIVGRDIRPGRDPHQRPGCLCARSVDIGAYGTCSGACLYCYAGGGGKSPKRD